MPRKEANNMVSSKEWDWKNIQSETWLKPSEDSFYYAEKWRAEGRTRLLDLGCGLGRHSVFFDAHGFRVTAIDLSEYGVDHLREWQKKNGTDFRAVVGDMTSLPFADNAFDCIYSYHVLSHTDSEGIKKVFSEIHRVLKPGGEIYFDLCSKQAWHFRECFGERLDGNTIRFTSGPEEGIPHYFADEEDVRRLLGGFNINVLRHIDTLKTPLYNATGSHWFAEADAVKEEVKPDYSGIIGQTVSGKIDRPKGSAHPRIPELIYPVNYGYVDGVFAADGSEQDIYLLGEDSPVGSFTGKVIAVWHRYNDVEDKWIVSADGRDYTDDEIAAAIDFQEKYFEGEVFR
ncbi:MAG: methyltransferase domain-containing protein [Ruminiclostridium sp.]|nr:methyltransferase domain-containing protein [Ruminiclostridium sp.]